MTPPGDGIERDEGADRGGVREDVGQHAFAGASCDERPAGHACSRPDDADDPGTAIARRQSRDGRQQIGEGQRGIRTDGPNGAAECRPQRLGVPVDDVATACSDEDEVRLGRTGALRLQMRAERTSNEGRKGHSARTQ